MEAFSYCNACGKVVEHGRVHCDACSTASTAVPAATEKPAQRQTQRRTRRRPAPARRGSWGALGGVIGIGILLAIFVPMHSRIIDAAIRLVEGKKAVAADPGESGPGYRIVWAPPPEQPRSAPEIARHVPARPVPARRTPRSVPLPPVAPAPTDRSLPSAPQDSGLRPPARPYGLPPLPSEDTAGLSGARGGPQPNGIPSEPQVPARPVELVTLAKASFTFNTAYERVLTDQHRPPGSGVPGVPGKVRVYAKVPISTKAVLRVRFDVPDDLEGLYEIRVRAPELGLQWQTILIPEEVSKGVVRFTFEAVFEGGPPPKIRYRHASLWPAELEWSVVPMDARYGG